MPKYDRLWEGGYVWRDRKGRDHFWIKRRVDGHRFELNTYCTTLKAAMEQLKRFEADPEGFSPSGSPTGDALHLGDDLRDTFLDWSEHTKRNSHAWVNRQRNYLTWWQTRLEGLDLRRVSLVDHINPALADAAGARGLRIAVLKAFYAWLRKVEHRLSVAQDPTFQTLTVPQSRPEQWKRLKAIPKAHYEKVRAKLPAHWRDPLDIQAGTGWHITEVQRFAKSGSVEAYPRAKSKGIGGVLVCPQTKGGEMLKTAVSANVFAAGKRLLERGSLSKEKYGMAVVAACAAARVPKFTPGQFRHSVATWAINNGADPAQVAAFLNHKSPRTTKKFYATHAVPTKVPTLV